VLGYVFLAVSFLAALAILIALDIVAAASAHRRFIILYSGFWMLLGLALLHDCPWRLKLPILGLFSASILLVCAIPWNRRKPLLQSLYRIKVGMTEIEVDRIMGDYAKQTSPRAELNGRGEIVTGTVRYRCPAQDGGGSLAGALTFELGRVVQIRIQREAIAASRMRESG
jgi:hypothetical protein